jgi:hypothetical protein
VQKTTPPIAPSIVFLGLTDGSNLCLPKSIPVIRAHESVTQAAIKAKNIICHVPSVKSASNINEVKPETANIEKNQVVITFPSSGLSFINVYTLNTMKEHVKIKGKIISYTLLSSIYLAIIGRSDKEYIEIDRGVFLCKLLQRSISYIALTERNKTKATNKGVPEKYIHGRTTNRNTTDDNVLTNIDYTFPYLLCRV